MITINPNEKIIFYKLRHINDDRLNINGRAIIDYCPVYWWKNNMWEDNKYKSDMFMCRIDCIVYSDYKG